MIMEDTDERPPTLLIDDILDMPLIESEDELTREITSDIFRRD